MLVLALGQAARSTQAAHATRERCNKIRSACCMPQDPIAVLGTRYCLVESDNCCLVCFGELSARGADTSRQNLEVGQKQDSLSSRMVPSSLL